MACRSGCPTQDHASWGECARAADIQIDRHGLSGGRDLDKAKDKRLDRYASLREQGCQPTGIDSRSIHAAEVISDTEGKPFRAIGS